METASPQLAKPIADSTAEADCNESEKPPRHLVVRSRSCPPFWGRLWRSGVRNRSKADIRPRPIYGGCYVSDNGLFSVLPVLRFSVTVFQRTESSRWVGDLQWPQKITDIIPWTRHAIFTMRTGSMPRAMPMPSPGSSRATRTHSQKFGTAFASWRRSSLAGDRHSFGAFRADRIGPAK